MRPIDADSLKEHILGDSTFRHKVYEYINKEPTIEDNPKTNLEDLIEKFHKSDTPEYVYMLIKRISGGYPCGCCVYWRDCVYDGKNKDLCESGVFKWFRRKAG